MIDLCTLGTGGAIPLPDRGLASLYVRMNGNGLLIDCGEGTQTAIRKLGWGFRHIQTVFLTHYHGDHCSGLPGFLLSMAKTGRDQPLEIVGPPGLCHVVSGLRVIVPELPYPLILNELPADGGTFRCAGLDCTAFPLHHSVPCFGLQVMYRRTGRFQPEKAKAFGIPVSLWKQLQQGEPVAAEGKVFLPEQVLGPEKTPVSFLYATDTRPVDAIVNYGRGSSMMILEGMYDSDDKMPQARKNCHMTYREAAELARTAGTEHLVLTHFSNCIEDPSENLSRARDVFPDTDCAEDLKIWSIRLKA